MNGLGHRVALLRHLIVFSLRGLDLGFIRTHVFHCIGVGCSSNQVARDRRTRGSAARPDFPVRQLMPYNSIKTGRTRSSSFRNWFS